MAAPAAGSSAAKKPASASKSSDAAAASPTGATSNGTANQATDVSDTQVGNAVLGWMNDTGKVTKFLNTATSFTGDEYTKQATIAFNAEVDELNHKAILDAALGDQPDVQAANDTLATKGTFQAVVDALQAMVNEGPDTAQQRVTEINNNRCVNVLPNINKYFAAAGSGTVSAVVPTGCLEVDPTNASAVGPAAAQATPADAPAGDATGASASDSSSSSASDTTTARAQAAKATGNSASKATSGVKAQAAKATSSPKA
ncbi:hypothetical protein B0O99DRAFT_694795 [Bisporella sp. PMI_857]|nr:hypothetical protein B0O99DRAFT_694795 [Bisporella sp. PMI_857]